MIPENLQKPFGKMNNSSPTAVGAESLIKPDENEGFRVGM